MTMSMNPARRCCQRTGKSGPVRGLAACLASTAILMTACGTPPPTHWHSLLPAEPPAALRVSGTYAGQPMPIVLAPLGLPAQVDQPQLLLRLPDGSLTSLEQERWASPLRDELRSALLERLANRYDVVESRGEAAGSEAPLRVAVTLTRFDSVLGREALIEGSWLASKAAAGTPRWSCRWIVREPAVSGGAAALALAHQKAWARLADALGEGLRATNPACPRFDAPA